MQARRNISLKSLNTFGVAGTAALAWTLENLEQVDPLIQALAGRTAFILGGGSNVLFARELHEPVVLVRLRGRQLLDDDGTAVLLEVGSGEGWDDVVRYSMSQGWYGLENLALIPGLAGGAPWQNIGAYGVEVATLIESVQAVHTGTGERRGFSAGECDFGYRRSFFKSAAGSAWLVTSIRLRLSREANLQIGYGEIQQELSSQGAAIPPSPHQVAAAVRSIRRRKLPDPAVLGNAGSFFKNPLLRRDEVEPLLAAFPHLPVYPVPVDAAQIKLSAGWLIETAGWKGFREGDAGVSAHHALVLVNHGNATGAEVLALARRIQASVRDRFGILLEPEPVIVD